MHIHYIHYPIGTVVIDGWHHIEVAVMGDVEYPRVVTVPPTIARMFDILYTMWSYIHIHTYACI